jgi:hypothetical protein
VNNVRGNEYYLLTIWNAAAMENTGNISSEGFLPHSNLAK